MLQALLQLFFYFRHPHMLQFFYCGIYFITALHVMQTQYSEEISVCPSVCLSVCLSHAWIVTKR